jgi:hypothetical protein
MEWLTLLAPLMLWLKIMWAEPYAKPHRRRLSLALSIAAGLLAFAGTKLNCVTLVIFSFIPMAAMLIAMFLPLANDEAGQRRAKKRTGR